MGVDAEKIGLVRSGGRCGARREVRCCQVGIGFFFVFVFLIFFDFDFRSPRSHLCCSWAANLAKDLKVAEQTDVDGGSLLVDVNGKPLAVSARLCLCVEFLFFFF